jgi:integrase
MRIGEACGLRWRYVNLTENYIIVGRNALPPNSIQVSSARFRSERSTTKAKSTRPIPLTSEAWVAQMLQDEMSSRCSPRESEHNWTATISRTFKKAAKKVSVPWCTPHCLRHCTRSMADQAGLTVAEKQKILGAPHRGHVEPLHASGGIPSKLQDR